MHIWEEYLSRTALRGSALECPVDSLLAMGRMLRLLWGWSPGEGRAEAVAAGRATGWAEVEDEGELLRFLQLHLVIWRGLGGVLSEAKIS